MFPYATLLNMTNFELFTYKYNYGELHNSKNILSIINKLNWNINDIILLEYDRYHLDSTYYDKIIYNTTNDTITFQTITNEEFTTLCKKNDL